MVSSTSPPMLSLPRQPSPLHFAMSPEGDEQSLAESSISSQILPSIQDLPLSTEMTPAGSSKESLVPVEPLADSLLYRSTIAHMESSTLHLKRMAKAIISQAEIYRNMLEQVEKAEDDLLANLGELGKWLEGGFAVQGKVWTEDDRNTGIRSLRKEKWRAAREEMEVMVEGSVRALKGDLKRQGLAGGGAHERYDRLSKQFYQQTSTYLASDNHGSSSKSSNPIDDAQATRSAQYDLARYNHHSTLLYVVPPTSVTCLDLLVKMYSWVGGLLGEATPWEEDDSMRKENPLKSPEMPPRRRRLDSKTSRSQLRVEPTTQVMSASNLKASLAGCLAKLSELRGDLLDGWAERNIQTSALEDVVANLQSGVRDGSRDSSGNHTPQGISSSTAIMPTTPLALHAGIENIKSTKKIHKIQRSMGGRLKDFLSSSASTTGIAALAERGHLAPPIDKAQRASFESSSSRDMPPPPIPSRTPKYADAIRSRTPDQLSKPTPKRASTLESPIQGPNNGGAEGINRRPSAKHRHSLQVIPDSYSNPIFSRDLFPLVLGPDGNSGTGNTPIHTSPPATPESAPAAPGITNFPLEPPVIMGVGGMTGGGDEDETREAVGRKKEGVLWGGGVWDELVRSSGKMKWEKFWVVLDRSRIYEYRYHELDRPESAHAVIDLKFASVREGRGTERRFVFEIVTPTQGRRLYQATSEAEMKQWLYAICNAIESSINGTSTVKTFDASKLRTVSGSLDDHALPARAARLFPGLPTRHIGLGLPTPKEFPTGPGNRRSMPPLSEELSKSPLGGGGGIFGKRTRQRSFKKALKHGAEVANERWSSVINPRSGGSLDIPRPGAQFFQDRIPSGSSAGWSSITSGDDDRYGSDRNHRSGTPSRDDRSRSSELDEEIAKRVHEMAGLGLGESPLRPPGVGDDRRIHSESIGEIKAKVEGSSSDMTRSKSEETRLDQALNNDHGSKGREKQLDMRTLREIAELPGNNRCADCGKSMKSSRWATIAVRDYPMVLFLCIRCCGVHRSLGTHVSKPRSVDLDIWTPESIAAAQEWGNVKGNNIWEKLKPSELLPSDENIAEYIRMKYVEGKWLASESVGMFNFTRK